MELIQISDTKLKIMLNKDDIERYDIDLSNVSYSSTETRRAFWSILDEVKHQIGFDAASERVLVQLYPSREGGGEMFVTKLGLLTYTDETDEGTEGIVECLPHDRTLVYTFNSVGDLIAACRLASNAGHISQSTAWIDDIGKCYLFALGDAQASMEYLCGLMSEYGTAEEFMSADTYIKEHGRQLCVGDAVEKLASF